MRKSVVYRPSALAQETKNESGQRKRQMKAAVCHEFGAPLIVEDIKIGDAGQGAVKVKISACAICHSDIIYADGAWGGTLPAVYGHEAAGVVEQVGPGVAQI